MRQTHYSAIYIIDDRNYFQLFPIRTAGEISTILTERHHVNEILRVLEDANIIAITGIRSERL